ncbi:MAG TPA: hypothetical protein VFN10_06370 [Thermoanaerobaculia bacterium]|nr:hypothetical protein [Thermoanaerobaculia bacterium]
MLNIAGPQFDFANVVYAVLEECEHRRRSFDDAELDDKLTGVAIEKLKQVKAAYDEYGGGAGYWQALQKEVLETAMPQYIDDAREINALERNGYGVWRGGDIGARLLFALLGLVIGSIIVALPFIPIVESMFAFALTIGGFVYPDIKRFQFERRHASGLNALIDASARYQEDSRLHFMTTKQITEAFVPENASTVATPIVTTSETPDVDHRNREIS